MKTSTFALSAAMASLLPAFAVSAASDLPPSPWNSMISSCVDRDVKLPFAMSETGGTSGTSETAGILNDYIYGFVPVFMRAVCELETAVPDNTIHGAAPINQFAYNDRLVTPQTQTIVRSNVDTLYTPAWLNLAREPLVLHVPDTDGRYYLIPMLDAYSDQFESIGSRTTGTGAGNYAIVGPDWQGATPTSVDRVIKSPTNIVWLLGRTLVSGQADLPSAVNITRQFLLIPLSQYPQYLQTGRYTPPSGVPVAPPNPAFVGQPLFNSPGFNSPVFFDYLLPFTLLNPAPADQRPAATALVVNGFINQRQMTPAVQTRAFVAMNGELKNEQVIDNGWTVNLNLGDYGSNYLLRDAVAVSFLGASLPADSIYWSTSNDSGFNPLSGADSYVIHFAPGEAPPARGFWSITAYDQQGFLVPNSANRYDVGSNTAVVPNSDGSVDIFLQTVAPSTHQSNWLPVPAGAFNLVLRVYWPAPSVLSRAWKPAAVSVANAPLP
jgi:hypothetical protein